ncbi:MAG: DNA polymerase [Oscillospiraceae bacterium]|nr:DNA polymerase [Oscillospiraceae bacterium]
MNKFLLIDGNSLVYRAFYAIKPLSNKSGLYTNAVSGFFTSLLRLRAAHNPDCIAVAFDVKKPTFRHKLYDGYKKRRKGMPPELAEQMPYVKQILDFMGIARVELAGYEADDVIGTLAKAAEAQGADALIATGDRDAFQLISARVSVALASTKEELVYTPAVIAEKYGIEPAQFIEIKALMGDASDDIPGVSGIGEKTAFSLISKFGSVDRLYESIDSPEISPKIKESARAKLESDTSREMCRLSRDLARINTAVPLENTALSAYAITEGDEEGLAAILSELELAGLAKKLKVDLSAVTAPPPLTEDSAQIAALEAALEPVLRDMERVGVCIDVQGLRRFGEELQPQIAELQRQIYTLAGEEFNIASPKQLGEILFAEDKLALAHGKKTKTGYSTNAEVLEQLADKHEIIPLILEYRELTKLDSTYVQGLLKCVSGSGNFGRVHTTYKSETRTGRISSVEPNLQNIPVRTPRGRVLRRFFVAEEGRTLISADYSQIELRVLAAISEDENLLTAFRAGADIHGQTAQQVFGSEKFRSAAKAVNFGIVYGMGAFSLAKEIGVPVPQARDYIELYLARYPGVGDYLERVVEEAKRDGYVKTLLGRVRAVPEIRSFNKNIVQAGERIAKNTPIQGTAADIIKLAMIRVHEALPQGCNLILQIHDELIIEAPETSAEQAAAVLEREMLAVGSGLGETTVELAVDVRTGRSWYEC